MFICEYRRTEDIGEFVCLNTVQTYKNHVIVAKLEKEEKFAAFATAFHRDTPAENLTQHFCVLHKVLSITGKFKS